MRISPAAFILVALLACKRSQPAPTSPPPPPPPAAPAATPPPASLPEAQVKALLDEWLAAQNAGAFDRYEKLYASRFQGVRRSGPRTVRLDRAGWVADRKRMFGKPMSVALADLELVRSATMARAQFQQTWASGNYKDVGRKQLVIVREGDGLRIAREELLESRLLGAGHRDLSEALMLADATGVILTTRPEEGWASGEARPAPGPYGAMRSVEAGALPAEVARWRQRKVKLMGKDGPLCDGTIAGLTLVGRVTPHFGTVQEWQGMSGGEQWTADRIAAGLWAESAGDGRILSGDLAQRCEGALWAFDAEKTPPAAAAASSVGPGPLMDASARAFRALPLHAELQKAWLADGGSGPWSAGESARTLAWRFDHPRGTLVMVSALRMGGCNEWSGDLTALFTLGGREAAPKLELLSALSYGELAAPQSAFDLDGDGQLEILFGPEGLRKERGLYQLAGDAYDRFVLYQQPFHDCGC